MIFAVYADGRYEGAWRAYGPEDAIRRAKRLRTQRELPPAIAWRAEALIVRRALRGRPGEPDGVAEQRLDYYRENPEEGENE